MLVYCFVRLGNYLLCVRYSERPGTGLNLQSGGQGLERCDRAADYRGQTTLMDCMVLAEIIEL